MLAAARAMSLTRAVAEARCRGSQFREQPEYGDRRGRHRATLGCCRPVGEKGLSTATCLESSTARVGSTRSWAFREAPAAGSPGACSAGVRSTADVTPVAATTAAAARSPGVRSTPISPESQRAPRRLH